MTRFSTHGEHMIERAKAFATAAHGAIDQRRKYTCEPYIVHPASVVELISRPFVGATWEMICAAWLHDVVEDTKVQNSDIYDLFGMGVGSLIEALTDVPSSAGNRAARHKMNLDRLAQSISKVQTIKVADLIDNTKSIVKYDPKFAKLYIEEKSETLTVLTRANPQLLLWAHGQLGYARGELSVYA